MLFGDMSGKILVIVVSYVLKVLTLFPSIWYRSNQNKQNANFVYCSVARLIWKNSLTMVSTNFVIFASCWVVMIQPIPFPIMHLSSCIGLSENRAPSNPMVDYQFPTQTNTIWGNFQTDPGLIAKTSNFLMLTETKSRLISWPHHMHRPQQGIEHITRSNAGQ